MSTPPATSISWASAGKWAVRGAGDAVLVVELRRGRFLGLIVDVQGAGAGASTLAWSLAALGVHIGGEGGDARTIAEMVNRALCTRRGGRVQASLGVAVLDSKDGWETARYGSIIANEPAIDLSNRDVSDGPPAGLSPTAAPVFTGAISTVDGLCLCSDGIAASRSALHDLLDESGPSADADDVLRRAIDRDGGRPRDDMSVIVVKLSPSGIATSTVSGRVTVSRQLPSSRERHGVADER